MKILTAASLGSNFTCSYKKNKCITTPGNNLYNHIQCAEGNHYIAIKGELLHFGDATCFCFQSDSSFVSK